MEHRFLTEAEVKKYIGETLHLMNMLNIKIRDTWINFKSMDVYKTLPEGDVSVSFTPYKLLVRIGNPKYSGFTQDQCYHYGLIGGPFKSLAYLNPCINLREEAWKNRRDHLVHEIVHYLQHVTTEEHNFYSGDTGDMLAYMAQRTELEAHYVQVAHLMRYNRKFRRERIPKELAALAEQAFALPFDPRRALAVCIKFRNARLF